MAWTKNTVRAAICALIFGLVVTGCARSESPRADTPTSSPPASAPTTPTLPATGAVYTYLTESAFISARGDTEVGRIAIVHPVTYPGLAATADKNFHFVVATPPADAETKTYESSTVFAFDAKTGAPATPIRCGCYRAYPADGSSVIWWQAPNTIMRADLAAPDRAPAVWRTVELPAPAAEGPWTENWGKLSDPAILAASPDRILLYRGRNSGGYALAEYVYSLDADNTIKQYGSFSNSVLFAIPSPDGHSFALYSDEHVTASCTEGRVAIIDTESGTARAITPFEVDSGDRLCSFVSAPRWSATEGLSVTIRRYTSSATAEISQLPGGRWKYSDTTWTQSTPDHVLDAVTLDTDHRLELTEGAQLEPKPALSRDLYLVTADGNRKLIASGILGFSAAVPL